jgi:methionyl-tRNA synthetase
VANIANFFYRVLSFCGKNFEGEVLPADDDFLAQFAKHERLVVDSFLSFETRTAV